MAHFLRATHVKTKEQARLELDPGVRWSIGRENDSSRKDKWVVGFDLALSRDHFSARLEGGKLLVERDRNRHPILFKGVAEERFTLSPGENFATAHTLFDFEEQGLEATFRVKFQELVNAEDGHAQRCLAALLALQPVLSTWRAPQEFFQELLPLLRAVAPAATSLQAYRADRLDQPMHQLGLGVAASRTLLRSALDAGEGVFHLWDTAAGKGIEPTAAVGINWALACPIPAVTETFLLYVVGMQEVSSGSGLPGQQDRALVTLMAKLVSQYFASGQTAQLLAEVEAERRQREVSDRLRGLTSRLSESLRLEETCMCLLEALHQSVPHERAALFLRDEQHLRLISGRPASSGGWENFSLDRIAPFLGPADSATLSLTSWKSLFPNWPHSNNEGLPGLLLPLRLRGQLGAVIALWNPFQEWQARDVDLLVLLGSQAPAALQNAHLYRKVERMAVTDELTGIYNRRQFFTLADAQWRRGSTFSALLMDVDHFKQFNDRFGHAVGDAVLRHVAQLCQSLLGREVIFARYGGEEFAAVSLAGLEAAAEKLRLGLEKTPLVYEGQTYQVLASFGVAHRTAGDSKASDVLNRADTALYQAKQAGRNQVKAL